MRRKGGASDGRADGIGVGRQSVSAWLFERRTQTGHKPRLNLARLRDLHRNEVASQRMTEAIGPRSVSGSRYGETRAADQSPHVRSTTRSSSR